MLGRLAAIPPGHVTAWQLAAGVALAAVLLLGYRVLPGIWLGAFAGSLVVLHADANGAAAGRLLVVASGMGLVSTLQAFVPSLLIVRLCHTRNPFNTTSDFFRFFAIAAVMCAVSCAAGVVILCTSGFAGWAMAGPNWVTSMLADITGILIVTPLLIAWSAPRLTWRIGAVAEAIVLSALLVVMCKLIFGGWLDFGHEHRAARFLLLPFLVWATIRFDQRGLTAALTVVSAACVWETARGIGPFVSGSLNESILMLQGYLAIQAITFLTLAAVVTERRCAEEELRSGRDELEGRIHDHTADLTAANQALQAEVAHSAAAEARVVMLNRVLETISEINQLIVRGKDRDELLSEACRILVERGRMRSAWVGLVDTTANEVEPVAWAGPVDCEFGAEDPRHQRVPLDRYPIGAVVGSGQYVIVEAADTEARTPPHGVKADPGCSSSATFPLMVDGNVAGIINVCAAEPDTFNKDVIAQLDELANDLGYALQTTAQAAERRCAEEALHQEKLFSDTVVDSLPGIFFMLDAQGRFLRCNKTLQELLGFAAGAIVQMDVLSVICEEHKDRVARAIRETFDRGQSEVEAALVTKDGSLRHFLLTGRKMEIGGVPYHVGNGTDITQRKQAEDALRNSEHKYRTLAENLPQRIFLKDTNSVYLSCNANYARDLGISPDEIAGKTDHDFYPKDLAEKHYADDRLILQSGTIQEIEEWRLHKGQQAFIHTVKTPVKGPHGEILGILGIFWDETDRKTAEAQIRDLNEDLERHVKERTEQLVTANKEMEAFSYSVSHDLRAPLRAIAGFCRQLLQGHRDQLDPEGCRLLSVVITNTATMSQLIDDLLALSHLGRQEFRLSRVDMATMARHVFEELAPEIGNRRIQLDIGALPQAEVDEAMIHQLWVNLLSNAVKFTRPRESPVVRIEGETIDHENIYRVIDNGVGFDMRYVDKLFGVFQRLHTRDEFEGTGVGLALVQRIVRRHGGRVWGEAKLNEGATFGFAVPTGDNEK